MLFFFLFGLSLAVLVPLDSKEMKLHCCGCPRFWFSFNGHCYKYVTTPMSWSEAEQHCVSQGANLVSIHSEEEETFVKTLIRNFDPAEGVNWIGLSDAQKDGAFFWSDGSKFTFSLWSAGEPNGGESEACVHTNWGETRNWNDKGCTETYSFVCKAQPGC